MKKKLLILMMAGCLVVTGCGKDTETSGDAQATGTPTPTSTEGGGLLSGSGTEDDTTAAGAYWEPQGSVVLGPYQGIEVAKVAVEVTDDEVQSEVDYFLYYQSELRDVTDRTTVQEGDIINVDYILTIDGEEVDNVEDYDIELGSDDMEFEEDMVGVEIGEEIEVAKTIADEYNYPDYVGQDGVYTVRVNAIKYEHTPELTDELVAENTDYATVEEYRQGLYDELYAAEEENASSVQVQNCFLAIIEQCEFSGLNEADTQSYVDELISYYESYANMYGMDMETFVLIFTGSSYVDFLAGAQEEADYVVKQNLILKAVIEKEGFELTDEEYAAGLAEYTTEYGYDSIEEFEEYAGVEEIKDALLLDKAYDLIISSMVLTEE